MTPKNFTDKADEWRSWHQEVAGYVDTMTPGMKKVLAEIDQEAHVMEQGDGGAHQPLEAAAENH